jgi:hypothetical protein
MKYLFQGDLKEIPDHLWPILKQVEPTVVKYEDSMASQPKREESKKGNDVGQGVVSSEPVKDEASLRTRQDHIKELQKRGFKYKDLRTKRLDELKQMI